MTKQTQNINKMSKLSKKFKDSRFTYFAGNKYFPNLQSLADYIGMSHNELFLLTPAPDFELNENINGFDVSIKNKEKEMERHLLKLKMEEA